MGDLAANMNGMITLVLTGYSCITDVLTSKQQACGWASCWAFRRYSPGSTLLLRIAGRIGERDRLPSPPHHMLFPPHTLLPRLPCSASRRISEDGEKCMRTVEWFGEAICLFAPDWHHCLSPEVLHGILALRMCLRSILWRCCL